MVRKQNERTILLQYRIITLSLPTKTLFLILASRPLSTRLGAFFSPKHFPAKFFRNFFQSCQGDFFLYFWCEKLWGLKALGAPQIGGGIPFCMLSTYQTGFSFPLSFLLSSCQMFRQTGQKGAKMNFSLVYFGVFSGFSETRRGKNLIYF